MCIRDSLNILRETAAKGTIVIAALHDLKLAKRFADQIWVLHDGQFVANEPASSALTASILKDVFRITPDGIIAT